MHFRYIVLRGIRSSANMKFDTMVTLQSPTISPQVYFIFLRLKCFILQDEARIRFILLTFIFYPWKTCMCSLRGEVTAHNVFLSKIGFLYSMHHS